MLRLISLRIADAIPTLFAISLVVFGLLEVAPGDATLKVLAAAGADGIIDERDVAARRADLGLDRSLVQRYVQWVGGAARLELGTSFVSKQSVTETLRAKLPASLVLSAVAVTLSVAISVPLGMLVAVYVNTWLDDAVRVVTLLGGSLPSFWMALAFMWLFAAYLQWLPALGGFTPRGIVLPALVLTIRTSALLVRVTRAAVLESLRADYVTVARAKGLGPVRVVWRHVLPNAAIPIITVIGLDFAGLLAHATVIEWVFAWPGIGRLGVDAVLANDTPMLMGFVLVASCTVLFVNLVVDIAYGIADPRLRTGGAL